MGISSTLKVVAADHDFGRVPPYGGKGRRPSRPEKVRAGAEAPSVKEWAHARAKAFRRVTWREGSKGKLSSRFATWRVRPAHRLSAGKEPLAACWLVAEWPAGEAEPTKYFFGNLPANTSLRRLVRTAKGRWWIENCLHWQLDVTFGEDASRIRKRHGAETFALLRRLALLKRHPHKGSMRTKRYMATLDVAFLEEILQKESNMEKL